MLEEQIIPAYYDRGPDGLPHRWIATMKEAIRTCAPAFSMRRMVKEYTTRFYVPDIRAGIEMEESRYEKARVLAKWKERVRQNWPKLELFVDGRREGQLSLGEGLDVTTWVRADGLQKEDLAVELVYGEARDDLILPDQTIPMNYIKKELDGSMRYAVRLRPSQTGSVGYGVRALPTHPALPGKYDMGLVRWA